MMYACKSPKSYRCVTADTVLEPDEYISLTRPEPTPPTAEELRTSILTAIDAHASALRDAAVAGISPAEMAAWSIKLAQAQAGRGALIEGEAAIRGVPLADLITKIIAKADAMADLEAHIAGTCGRHQDAVRAAAYPSAYDWSTDWPEVNP